MTSTCRWPDAVDTAAEAPALFKTTTPQARAPRALIEQRHPYDLPAIVELRVDAAASSEKFAERIAAETTPSRPRNAE